MTGELDWAVVDPDHLWVEPCPICGTEVLTRPRTDLPLGVGSLLNCSCHECGWNFTDTTTRALVALNAYCRALGFEQLDQGSP